MSSMGCTKYSTLTMPVLYQRYAYKQFSKHDNQPWLKGIRVKNEKLTAGHANSYR